ncbi:LysM peptidoglycan-binding domain-containing protein [Eionea flava]
MSESLSFFRFFGVLIGSLLLLACDATLQTQNSHNTDDAKPASFSDSTQSDKQGKNTRSSTNKNKDLWNHVRQGYQLKGAIPSIGEQRIQAITQRYSKHPKDIFQQTEQASLYLHYITTELEKHNMPTELALIPFVESRFDPFAYSSGRASGLWQFIPGTATRFKMQRTWWQDERRDIQKSTQSAIAYFRYLHKFFDGNWLHAIAAYNAGEGTVQRAIRRNQKAGKPTDYWSLPLPKQTQFYIPKLLAWARIIQQPQQYKLSLFPVKDTPRFTAIDVKSQIDLAAFAQLSDIPIKQVYALNPSFNRWATDPEPPHQLLVPVEKADDIIQRLANYPIEERMQWQRYVVKSGDVLGVIAEKYGTTLKSIKQANKLSSSRIRIGQTLVIPKASKSPSYYQDSAQQRLTHRQNSSAKKGRQRVNYVTRTGDTLWSIAKQYQVKPSAIAHWNNMSEKDVLRNKQTLVIWVNSTKTSTSAENAHTQSEKRKVLYTVRSGDNLSFIAQRFSVAVNDIRQWNNIQAKKYIKPGQVLKLFVTVAQRASL